MKHLQSTVMERSNDMEMRWENHEKQKYMGYIIINQIHTMDWMASNQELYFIL